MCDVVDGNHTSLNINCRSLCDIYDQVLRSGAVVNRDVSIGNAFLLVSLDY